MAELKALIKDILEKTYLMSLATVDKQGVWVCDLVYVSDNKFNIYWMSDRSRRHSIAIVKSPEVAATITLSDRKGMADTGLQISGTAKMLDGDVFDMSVKLNLKKGKPAPTKEGELLASAMAKYGGEYKWFVLKPTKIDVLYADMIGPEKQTLTLG